MHNDPCGTKIGDQYQPQRASLGLSTTWLQWLRHAPSQQKQQRVPARQQTDSETNAATVQLTLGNIPSALHSRQKTHGCPFRVAGKCPKQIFWFKERRKNVLLQTKRDTGVEVIWKLPRPKFNLVNLASSPCST